MTFSNVMMSDRRGRIGRMNWVYLCTVLFFFACIGCQHDRREPWTGSQSDATAGDSDEGGRPTCWFEANTGNPERCRESDRPDSDRDGLADAEESSLCTDPENGDTDGDGISDCEELERGLDPCAADTDGDGFDDREEAELCLDPTDPQRPTDRQEWIFSDCERTSPDLVHPKLSRNGLWQFATGRWTEGFSNAEYNGDQSWGAMSTFEIPDIRGRGAVTSFPVGDSRTSGSDLVKGFVESRLEKLGEVERLREAVPLPDIPRYFESTRTGFKLRMAAPRPISNVRNQAAMSVSGLDEQQFAGLPESNESPAERFAVSVGLSIEQRGSCESRDPDDRIGLAVIVVTPRDLDDRGRSIRRMASSPRKVGWGTSTTIQRCMRYPLARAPRIEPGDGGSGEPFLLELRRWVPGSEIVRTANQQVNLDSQSGYTIASQGEDISLTPRAIPPDFPLSSHRFATVRTQDWVVRCRNSCSDVCQRN